MATVDASPTKEFFIKMLTRDIALEDAILDLLDNCLDGIVRIKGNELCPTAVYRAPVLRHKKRPAGLYSMAVFLFLKVVPREATKKH